MLAQSQSLQNNTQSTEPTKSTNNLQNPAVSTRFSSSNILLVTNTNDSGAGSLRQAIQDAKSGNIIKFSAILADRTIFLKSQLSIPAGKNLTIDSGDARNLTINGNNQTRLFYLNSTSATPTNLTLKNLALVNGYTSDRGGAISTTHQGNLNEWVISSSPIAWKYGDRSRNQ